MLAEQAFSSRDRSEHRQQDWEGKRVVVDKGTREGPEREVGGTGLVVFCTPETLSLNYYRPTRGIAWSLVFMIQTVAQERGGG